MNSNRTAIMYPGGITASSTHDVADREASLTVESPGNPSQSVVSAASYLPFGPLSGATLGNGLTEVRLFDNRYRQDRIRLLAGATPRLDWDYTLDGVGNPTSIADLLGGPARTFAYQDIAYFLTQGDGPWGNRTWTYDRIGNRKTETRPGITDSYVYATNGTGGNTPKLTQVNLGGASPRTYSYGAAGHVAAVATSGNTVTFTTSDSSRTSRVERLPGLFTDFSYDGRDFLSQATGEIPPAQLLYPPAAKGAPGTPIFSDNFEDGTGCAWTTVTGPITPPQTNCPKTTFLTATPTYSSEGLLHHLLRDNTAGQLDLYYLYFAGRPVAQLEADGGTEVFKWLTTDHLGTPVAATSGAGAVLWSGGFEAFGADWNNASGANIELRLPGQWMNAAWEESSLGAEVYYNVHRWYEHGTGRYTRVDPAGMRGDQNPYAYAQSSPLFWTDPFGEKSRACCTPIAGGILKPWNHCFIELKDDTTGESTTYSLHGMGGRLRNFGGPLGCTFENASFDRGSLSPQEAGTTCGEWNESCGADECVELQFGNYPRASEYSLSGTNSNTFAGTVARACGLQGPPIAGTWRTPGWNEPVAKPLGGRVCPQRW